MNCLRLRALSMPHPPSETAYECVESPDTIVALRKLNSPWPRRPLGPGANGGAGRRDRGKSGAVPRPLSHQGKLLPDLVRVSGRALNRAPVIWFFPVVEMANAGHMRGVAILLGPINRFMLSLENSERMIRVVLNDIVVDRASF